LHALFGGGKPGDRPLEAQLVELWVLQSKAHVSLEGKAKFFLPGLRALGDFLLMFCVQGEAQPEQGIVNILLTRKIVVQRWCPHIQPPGEFLH
jgi:hypothetical protein